MLRTKGWTTEALLLLDEGSSIKHVLGKDDSLKIYSFGLKIMEQIYVAYIFHNLSTKL